MPLKYLQNLGLIAFNFVSSVSSWKKKTSPAAASESEAEAEAFASALASKKDATLLEFTPPSAGSAIPCSNLSSKSKPETLIGSTLLWLMLRTPIGYPRYLLFHLFDLNDRN